MDDIHRIRRDTYVIDYMIQVNSTSNARDAPSTRTERLGSSFDIRQAVAGKRAVEQRSAASRAPHSLSLTGTPLICFPLNSGKCSLAIVLGCLSPSPIDRNQFRKKCPPNSKPKNPFM